MLIGSLQRFLPFRLRYLFAEIIPHESDIDVSPLFEPMVLYASLLIPYKNY